MPIERWYHRFHPETSGIPGALPNRSRSQLQEARSPRGCQKLRNTSQATLSLIASTRTLYGPIHLNQSCYLGNEPRWRISLRSNYPLCLLHVSLPTPPQDPILLISPSCSGAAPLSSVSVRRETFQNRRALSGLDSLARDDCHGV